MLQKIVFVVAILGSLECLWGCHKKEFLDEKPSSDLFVPSTLTDFQELLDNDPVMSETPILGELCADNYYLRDSYWPSLSTKERNAYIWAPDIYQGESPVGDWNVPYKEVFYTNVVLDGIDKVAKTAANTDQWNLVKGSALFMRAYAFYSLAQVFAKPYDAATAEEDLGIPLRLTPNVDAPTTRSTVSQTYNQILSDLEQATALLPNKVSYLNRPSKPVAFALLARTYISMRMYDKAGAYADSSLRLYDTLYDYNSVPNPGSNRPFDKSIPEIMYQSRMLSSTSVLKGISVKDCIIDSSLYKSYSANDLRKTLFFNTSNNNGQPYMKQGYNGMIYCFSGFSTDEMYLVRAECRARAGAANAALDDLNHLLQTRWLTNTYVPYTGLTAQQALDTVLCERRKELPFRGIRWTDLRRLNMEGYNIIPRRMLNGTPYSLPPNSPLYVLPIPPDVIILTKIPDNNRN